jgi:hypothetical protein
MHQHSAVELARVAVTACAQRKEQGDDGHADGQKAQEHGDRIGALQPAGPPVQMLFAVLEVVQLVLDRLGRCGLFESRRHFVPPTSRRD